MSINPIVERHLLEARDELVAQRSRLDEDIAKIDFLIQGADSLLIATAKSSPKPPALTVGDPSQVELHEERVRNAQGQMSAFDDGSSSPAMRDAILDYLLIKSAPVKTQTIAKDIAARFDWAESSVRSLISRLARDGEIVAIRRGLYAASPIDGIEESLRSAVDEEDDLLNGYVTGGFVERKHGDELTA